MLGFSFKLSWTAEQLHLLLQAIPQCLARKDHISSGMAYEETW